MSAALPLCACVCAALALLPYAEAAVPGTFFWRPRVALDLATPERLPQKVSKPTKTNVYEGKVVLINGYKAGMTVAAIAGMMSDMQVFRHLSPTSAFYYTNMYRWMLRYLSLIPEWLGSQKAKYTHTHKVYRKRFFYMDKFVPQWLRHVFFFVKKEDWEREEWEWSKFVKYAEPAFGKQYRFPSKKFNDYKSFIVSVTAENLDITNMSIKM